MCRSLRPHAVVETVLDIDYEMLARMGKRALLFDLDKTLGGHRVSRLDSRVTQLLADLESRGFRIGIITNRRRIHHDELIASLSAEYLVLAHARKPLRSGYLRILERLGVSRDEAVMIGNRRMTDVLGARRAGLYAILLRGWPDQ